MIRELWDTLVAVVKQEGEFKCDGCHHEIKKHEPPKVWSNAPCTVENCTCKEAIVFLGG